MFDHPVSRRRPEGTGRESDSLSFLSDWYLISGGYREIGMIREMQTLLLDGGVCNLFIVTDVGRGWPPSYYLMSTTPYLYASNARYEA